MKEETKMKQMYGKVFFKGKLKWKFIWSLGKMWSKGMISGCGNFLVASFHSFWIIPSLCSMSVVLFSHFSLIFLIFPFFLGRFVSIALFYLKFLTFFSHFLPLPNNKLFVLYLIFILSLLSFSQTSFSIF